MYCMKVENFEKIYFLKKMEKPTEKWNPVRSEPAEKENNGISGTIVGKL